MIERPQSAAALSDEFISTGMPSPVAGPAGCVFLAQPVAPTKAAKITMDKIRFMLSPEKPYLAVGNSVGHLSNDQAGGRRP